MTFTEPPYIGIALLVLIACIAALALLDWQTRFRRNALAVARAEVHAKAKAIIAKARAREAAARRHINELERHIDVLDRTIEVVDAELAVSVPPHPIRRHLFEVGGRHTIDHIRPWFPITNLAGELVDLARVGQIRQWGQTFEFPWPQPEHRALPAADDEIVEAELLDDTYQLDRPPALVGAHQ